MWKRLKDRATRGAMKVVNSERAKRVLNSEEFQDAVVRAVTTGLRVRRDLSEARRALAAQLEIATGDDLADLKRQLEALEERMETLGDERSGSDVSEGGQGV
jgi:ubiquinone biosynthesis protein UbiJ